MSGGRDQTVFTLLMFWILIALGVGFLTGFLRRPDKQQQLLLNQGVTIIVLLLILTMGITLGGDGRIVGQLGELGIAGFIIAAATIVGSIIPVVIVERAGIIVVPETVRNDPGEGRNGGFPVMTLIIPGVLGTGIVVGASGSLPEGIVQWTNEVTTVILACLLFVIGVLLGGDRQAIEAIRRSGIKFLIIPTGIVVGTTIGALLAGMVLGFEARVSAAVGFGFGWYSLSAVMIGKVMGVETGALALLANIGRELLTIIGLPIVVRYAGRLAAMAPGGATTMDVTLPFVVRYAGSEIGLLAFANGAVLSALVPILVPIVCGI